MGKMRSNGEGSIYKVKTAHGERWRAECTIGWDANGKRVAATGTGATKALAIERREANRQKMLVLQGKAPASTLRNNKVKVQKLTVADWLERWFKGLNPSKIGEETRRAHRSKIDLHINPAIGATPLALLTKQDIQKLFYQDLPNKVYDPKHPEKRLSAGAIKNIWKPLYSALTLAVEENLIATHPMHGVDKPVAVVKDVKIDGEKPRQLLEHLRGRTDQTKWLFTFLLGVRISEKLGLTWDCLNLNPKPGKPATVEIKQQLARNLSSHGCGPRTGNQYPCKKRSAEHCPKRVAGNGLYIKESTKSGDKRVLPIPHELHILLLEHKERRDLVAEMGQIEWIEHGPDGDETKIIKWEPVKGMENLVFTTDSGKPISHQQETKMWHELCEAYGFPTRERGHLNRHMTATLLAEANVPIEVCKMILGHNSDRVAELYRHLETTKQALEPLQALELTLMDRKAAEG